MKRHSGDDGAAPRGALLDAEMHRQLRPAVPGGGRATARDGDCAAPVYQRAAVPHQVPRGDVRLYGEIHRSAALERRADPRLVLEGEEASRLRAVCADPLTAAAV